MNLKSLNIIEYNKLLEMVAVFASSKKAKADLIELLPMANKRQIDRQIDLTDEAYKVLMTFPNLHIGVIRDVSEAIDLAKIGSVLSPEDLLDIAGTLRTSRVLAKSIKDVQSDEIKTPLLNEISRYIGSFRNIEDRIFDSIISPTEIADNASKALYTIRRKIESTKTNIRIRLEKLTASQSMQKYLQDAIVTIRGGRFVVPVKSEYKSKVDGLVHDKSKGGSTFYIEPSFVIEMNNELKSLIIDEEEEIRRILAELSRLVKDRVEEIKITYESVCELDFVFAKARFAHSIDATKPIISDKKIIEIKQARHPFIDREVCVPIDFSIGNSYTALIITGPNTGGKTVAIKTVALLTAMALSGFFVPANSGAKFGVFEKIYADIGDEQSIDQSLSTFSSHMQNIVKMVEDAKDTSLLLFDEADSLFSKRSSDVSKSNDRYSNMNINVLLQLIERYEGVTVLTTNLKKAIDPAFERRFTYKVHFPLPSKSIRKRLWRYLCPPDLVTAEEIDYEWLSEIKMSGGEIKNAILIGAYMAARRGELISSEVLYQAALDEASSSGRVVRRGEHEY